MKNLINKFIQTGAGEWVAGIVLATFWVGVTMLLAGWLSLVSQHPYGAY